MPSSWYVDGKESAALESLNSELIWLNQKPSFVHLLLGFLGTLTWSLLFDCFTKRPCNVDFVFTDFHDKMDNLIENVDEKFLRQSHGLLTLRVKSDTDIIANLTFK